MAQYTKETYNVNTLFGGPVQFQQVADLVNSKYDTARWREFAMWGRTFRTPTWKGSISQTGIAIAAAVLSTNGQKPPRGKQGFGKYQGNIPMIGHMFNITADDIMTLRELEADGEDPQYLQQFQYSQRLDENIRGMHNRLNMFVFQGISSGYITADAQNNKEGVQNVLIDLGLKQENRLRPAKVWSDPTADPIADIINWQDAISEDPNAPSVSNILMSKALIKQLTLHPNVKNRVLGMMYPLAPNPESLYISRAAIVTALTELFGVLPIIEIDEKARVQQDGMWKEVKSFDKSVLVFCTPTNFFEMVGCRNIYDDDSNPNVAKIHFEGTHFTGIVEHFSNPFNIATSMEGFACPVPRDVNSWFVAKVDTTEVWGTPEQMLDVHMNAVKTVKNAEMIVINGEEYTRLAVVAALNAIGQTTGTNMKLANVQAKVESLTDGDKTSLLEQLNA